MFSCSLQLSFRTVPVTCQTFGFPAHIRSPLLALSLSPPPPPPVAPLTHAVREAFPSWLSSRISITCHVSANPSLLYSKLLSSSLPPCCLDTAMITQHQHAKKKEESKNIFLLSLLLLICPHLLSYPIIYPFFFHFGQFFPFCPSMFFVCI